MDLPDHQTTMFEQDLAALKRSGFLLLRKVLDPKTVAEWKEILYTLVSPQRKRDR